MVKNPAANARDASGAGSIPGSGRSPGEGSGNPLQSSCLGTPMDRGAWRATWGREESDPTEHTCTRKLSNQKQRRKEFSLFLPFCNFEFRPMHMHYRFKKSNMILKYIRIKKRETSSRETSPLKRRQEARRGRSQAGPGTTVREELSTTDLRRTTGRNTGSVRGRSRNSCTPSSVRN